MKLSKFIKDLEDLRNCCGDLDPEVEGIFTDFPKMEADYYIGSPWLIRFPLNAPQHFKVIIEFTKEKRYDD